MRDLLGDRLGGNKSCSGVPFGALVASLGFSWSLFDSSWGLFGALGRVLGALRELLETPSAQETLDFGELGPARETSPP